MDYGPIQFPSLSVPDDLALFARLGAAMRYMLPVSADVNDTFVQALGTLGLSVGNGFAWQGLDESVLAGLRRAARGRPDHRPAMGDDERDRQRLAWFSGERALQQLLGPERGEHQDQVGTELADQVGYLNCRVDADGEPLHGRRDYVLHFEPGQIPPVAGMWNLAM